MSVQMRARLLQVPTVSGPTFVFSGSDTTNVSSVTFTSTTIDIGAATSDRFVIVAASDQNGTGLTSVTVNGVSLAQDAQSLTLRGIYIWSGLVGTAGGSGPATIVATFGTGAGFTDRVIIVWTGRGMAHTAGAATTATDSGSQITSLNIAVTAGDLLIADVGVVATFNTSTETPTATRSQLGAGTVFTQTSPEWNKIISSNASFAINASTNVGIAAATYH